MTIYKVYSVDTDQGVNEAVFCDDKQAAIEAVCSILFDPDNTPPLTKEEKQAARKVLGSINEIDTVEIPGSAAWKEYVRVIPIDVEVTAI